ncbi:MAG: hypothetical protein JWR77_2651 [Rhizorhabdus sp.]|jgi:hypothetical protein|nr:hypothetical protein [Rhizorhabdus sp.]
MVIRGVTSIDQIIAEARKMQADGEYINGTVFNGLVAEIDRLREIERLALIYYAGYMQDEAEERDLCVSDEQHATAKSLRNALGLG